MPKTRSTTLRDTVGVRPDDHISRDRLRVGRVGRVLSRLCRSGSLDVSAEHAAIGAFGSWVHTPAPGNSGYDLQPIRTASVDVGYTTSYSAPRGLDRKLRARGDARVEAGGRFYCDNVDACRRAGRCSRRAAAFKPARAASQISKCSTQPEIETFLKHAGFAEVRVAGRLDSLGLTAGEGSRRAGFV